MKITNCINCGAKLQSNICEYCGTSYEKKEVEKLYFEDNIKLVKQDGDRKITLNVYGKDIDFYICSIDYIPMGFDILKDRDRYEISVRLVSYQ